MRANLPIPSGAIVALCVAFSLPQAVTGQGFKLAPAVAVEAEDFQVEKGWRVVANGHGNYMVDAVGFNHVSGERVLSLDGKDETGSAFLDVTLPEDGDYRVWVRYEYPAFCEARFRVVVEQGGKVAVEKVMGAKDSPRDGLGQDRPRAQHDPAWGPEGLYEEVVTAPGLKAGKARVWLKGTAQPQKAGVSADRNIDLVYLTRDTADAWLAHYRKTTKLYPILDAFRDSRGPRYEARFTNKGTKPTTFGAAHVYNRVPWGVPEAGLVKNVAPGATSDWVGLRAQDTTHFGLVRFTSTGEQPFEVEIRPAGGTTEKKLTGPEPVHVYLPTYPGKGETPPTPEERIDAILAALKKAPAIGKVPTEPLCYGGWLPLGQDNAYGRKYAELYAALGFRSLHPAHSGTAVLENLKAAGVPPTKSWAVSGYRNPPLAANVEQAKALLRKNKLADHVKWYDYGDEVAFEEWLSLLLEREVTKARADGETVKPDQALSKLWFAWLQKNRPQATGGDYWMPGWGPFEASRMRPDSSAAVATVNPRLYVDSLLFYEQSAISFVAEGAKGVRKALGDDVLCGANYSCHPFYYPSATSYIKWFRGGAADMGRHSDYFWQVGQAGPLANGYVAEHFRAGLRDNPRGVLRQYTMPHAPGNTDASFLRSAFTHLAHGATNLDFFGVGLNETFTENHIDHRAVSRFQALRDVTHAVGFVEDLLPHSRPVPSPVALLVSESTERWDFAGLAQDKAGRDQFGPDFRKARLHFHLDRLGIWTGLTFLGLSPDLLIEEDVTPKILKDYKLLVVVGDCLPKTLTPALEEWVKGGGVVLATAGAGRFDPYREPDGAFAKLLGLESRQTDDRTTFIRPRQELPFLEPLDTVKGDGWEMPALATSERITVGEGVEVLAKLKDDKPALVLRKLGKGRVYTVAARPGLAYLWSALQPPRVPDRGPTTHSVPTAFDKGARALLELVTQAAGAEAVVLADPPLIDARLLKAPKGYVLPLANYHAEVGQKVTLKVRVDGKVSKARSAVHGDLPIEREGETITIAIPKLGYGDAIRLDP